MQISEDKIALIVGKVLEQIREQAGSPFSLPISQPGGQNAQPSGENIRANGEWGVFHDIEQAMRAVTEAQRELVKISLERRAEFLDALRRSAIDHAKEWARLAHEETGMGRVSDKTQKNINSARLTPGLEDLRTESATGDKGAVLIERAPYGVIASIEPATHPVACLINHAISMLAGGNSIFFLPHPSGLRCAQAVVRAFNQAIVERDGPANLLVVLDGVNMDDLKAVLKHPGIDLIVATGGPAVVEMSLSSGKKAIGAGPGNPPVVVDETADAVQAARDIVVGHSFDNNLLCIAEKEIIAVDCKADRLLAELEKQPTYRLAGKDIDRLTSLVTKNGEVNRKYVGQNASFILRELGIEAGDEIRTIIMEVPKSHPLVKIEQMMPILPLVRVPNFEAALKLALEAEQGFGHTAMIHSQNLDHITRYARAMDTTFVVANAPSSAGLAVEGEGVYSHTIASPTGEGVATPRTYTRERRLAIGRRAFRFV
ncbi:Aldehyde dehydrogenase family [Acididesulfobacillus acetoxydans]|uniref:Aldehyde dehydrogenase family n=1 Tax=Acididesulfobacillus acetoxydans TaxID=1561005 RepID=A0A8S0VWW3_9FIRM|nr:aldehyde dehydrogenase family protein [Acididesulfobacillus acetoxydans]CAA7601303.1 Aldehyde dehydrogenase family [Acididesulfobacillus acetoxydans]CEJ08787.1 Ethanolamine utilization protein EutE [Acididesulfobacillus acetoxydans]